MKVINGVKLYGTRDLMEMLDLSEPTITAYRRKGLLRATRIGRSLYVSEEALDDYLNGRMGKGPGEGS